MAGTRSTSTASAASASREQRRSWAGTAAAVLPRLASGVSEDADHDDDAEDCDAFEGRIDDDRPDDVGDDQDLQAEQDAAAQITAQIGIGAVKVSARRVRTAKTTNAPSPPKTMMPVPTASTTLTTSEIVSS